MRILLVSLLALCISPVFSQNQQRPQSYGHWLMYFGDNKFNQKWGLHSELQLRNYFLNNTVEQTLARVGVNHYLGSLSMVTGGYAYIYTTPSGDNVEGSTTSEHRIWQQLILRHRTYRVFIEHRYRLEQRFIENQTTGDNIFDKRIRYRMMVLFPLYTVAPELRHFFLASYNELFMNLGRDVSGQLFDRNRLYFAIGYQWSPKMNIQVGYLNQVISIPNRPNPDVNHNLQIAISFNMDELGSLFSTGKSQE
jgi:hypothetical protein